MHLLAARDTLYDHWITHPRSHTRLGTLVLATLCNTISILDVRLLSLQTGTKRKIGINLTSSLPQEWKEFLHRPAREAHPSRFCDIFALLELQFRGTHGTLPADHHLVYAMISNGEPYVGRTAVHRLSALRPPSGIAPRWSEHVRELHQHMQGSVIKNRERRRYKELKQHNSSSCLSFLILDSCSADLISAREALAIVLVNPKANGNDLKHISEIFRKKRSRPPKSGTGHRPAEETHDEPISI